MKRLWSFGAVALIASACAQQPTAPPTNYSMETNGLPSVWQPGTTVTVYINGAGGGDVGGAEESNSVVPLRCTPACGSAVSYP